MGGFAALAARTWLWEAEMRVLVTGAGGLLGSNLVAAVVQQSWDVLGTWRGTQVSLRGGRTARLDLADRRACVTLTEELEPDVVIHAATESSPGRMQREPRLAELGLLGVEHTLAAARAVRARYVLVSCDLVFSGELPSGECWTEQDPREPSTRLGRSLLACERLTQDYSGSWLITRPADVYGVNLSIPAAANGSRARHVWEHSGPPLRWVAQLRAGQPLAAPAGIRRSPTYAWDYAQRVCELIAQGCDGVYNTAGPAILGRLAHLRLLARAFDCELQLVHEGSTAAFLRACGEEAGQDGRARGAGEDGHARVAGEDGRAHVAEEEAGQLLTLPPNTALCDHKASFVLGRAAADPFTGHRLMRRQLERVLGELVEAGADRPAAPLGALG